MGRTDGCRRAVAGQGLGAILTLVLMLAWVAGPAWGAAGVVGGSAQPVPSVTNPVVGQQYDVQVQLSNTSVSNSTPPGFSFIAVNVATAPVPPNPDEVAHVILACSTAPCGANELPGTVAFVPVGATGCVSAVPGVVGCALDPLNPNRVIITTTPNAVSLGPLQLGFPLATIRVQQLTRPPTFFMQGDATYQGIAGTCSGPGGTCSNVAAPNTCNASTPDCDFAGLAGAAVGTANIIPAASCGDSILDPGETCDPPGSVQPGGAICRTDCTFCGDGVLQAADGEACDDGNNVSGDGCSATCQVERCQVKVDKQVSCDGVTWSDVGLETANEDGTNGVTCPANAPVFVRYQVANTGTVDVANCTLTESNSVINPGGVVQSGISILAGQTLPETAPDSDQTCTDTLTAQEPNTATLSCECQLSQGGPLTVTATDTATIACQTTVGICRTPGFWAEHAGTEKKNSVNITQAVISAAPGGCIVVCGEKITNTAVNSANSALEAMCVTGQLQLPRQLMAAALNCIMTNGSADCTGTGIEDVFQACNAACPASKTAVVGGHTIDCIGAIDCFNNGGEFDPATGACTPVANNCHDQPLCNQDLGLCFEPPGPAGSTSACNQARHNSCAIIQPGEAQCATGTKDVPPETCP